MQKPNIILAIVGLPGSGKTEVTQACLQSGLFPTHIYLPHFVFEELDRKGLPHTQEFERPVRERLRAEHGMGVMAKLNIPQMVAGFEKGNVLLESMYSTEEYEIVKERFGDAFKVLAVYAPQSLRIERLKRRPKRPLTAAEVITRDMSQIKNTNQAGPIALADYTIINVGITLEELKQEVKKALQTLKIA